MNEREKIQYEAIETWINHDKRGTIVLVTGTGKTFIGVTIAGKQLEKEKIRTAAIIVPTINLVEQWQLEFEKWGYDIENIDFYCIQSAYKLKKEYDLVVIDEIHTTLSSQHRKVYENWKYVQLLGLTATIPEDEEYRSLLEKVCPVVYQKSFGDIEGKSIVSDYQVFNLSVALSKSDRQKYNTFNRMFAEARMQIAILKKGTSLQAMSAFDVAREYSKLDPKSNISDVKLIKYSKQFWSAMTMRKWICYNSANKVNTVSKIVCTFPKKKWIIFNKSIKFAELIKNELGNDARVYHSKMKTVEREEVLAEFKQGVFNCLVAVDALNAGLDVPDADGAICVSGVSTELVAIQQLGRVGRYKKSKFAIFINLYAPDTVEETWIEKKNKTLKSVYINKLTDIAKWLASPAHVTLNGI